MSQKQLFIAARLHQSATKAGYPFDLAEFSRDRSYALAELASLSSQLNDAPDRALLVEAMLSLQDPLAPLNAAPAKKGATVGAPPQARPR